MPITLAQLNELKMRGRVVSRDSEPDCYGLRYFKPPLKVVVTNPQAAYRRYQEGMDLPFKAGQVYEALQWDENNDNPGCLHFGMNPGNLWPIEMFDLHNE